MKLKVYKKEKPDGKMQYYAPITSEYNNKKSTYYLTVNFKKGIEIEDTSIIELKNCFFSSYLLNDKPQLKIIITEYDMIKKTGEAVQNYKEEKEEYADFGDIEISDDIII